MPKKYKPTEKVETKEKTEGGLIAEIERLRKELKRKKKYGLVWEDKPEEVVNKCKNELPIVKEVKSKEIITDKNKPVNLLIEGDNYHALSVLNYTHEKKVDVIYIDPPYNTGSENFIYTDNRYDTVKDDDPYRHSKWLSFMEKRLKLAKNLIKRTGVIFISIDDNEQSQLKLLCDEIFGENNFIALIIIQTNKGGRDYLEIAKTHEYLLCYGKSPDTKLFEIPKDISALKLKDETGRFEIRELRNRNPKFSKENRPNLYYPIYVNEEKKDRYGHYPISLKKSKKYNIEVYPKNKEGKDSCWRWGTRLLSQNIIEDDPERSQAVAKQKRDGGWNIYEKSRKSTTKAKSIWDESEVRTERGTIILRNVLGKALFDHPKPVELIDKVLRLSTKEDSLILDFFAGSGTTGQAVLELNKEDEGNRQFILCTNNENNNGKGHRIATDICYPRIEKIIKGYMDLKNKKVEGSGGNLKYFKTDFVDAEPTDKNKKKLTEQATEMLCIKEGTFEPVLDQKDFKIFKNSDHYTGIIFDQLAIPEFEKAIKDIKGNFSVYVFSLSDETFDEEFTDVKQKIKLSPIPEAILRVYRRILR